MTRLKAINSLDSITENFSDIEYSVSDLTTTISFLEKIMNSEDFKKCTEDQSFTVDNKVYKYIDIINNLDELDSLAWNIDACTRAGYRKANDIQMSIEKYTSTPDGIECFVDEVRYEGNKMLIVVEPRQNDCLITEQMALNHVAIQKITD